VRTTADGRLLAGKGGLASARGAHLGAHLFYSPRRAAAVQHQLNRLYPAFSDMAIERSWCGPVDRSSDGLPLLGALPGHENILYGIGWSGNGIAPSRVGGRALASLVLGIADEWSRSPLVLAAPRADFPREPLRSLGTPIVRAAVARKDRAESQGKQPGWLVRSVAAMAPKGVEDR